MIFVVQYLGSRWLSVAFTRRRSRSSLAINISQPHLLYDAHTMKREVTIHCGPTNSGKTHTALMAMKNAGSGVYCGPLRLLAWEVSEKLRDQGIQCDLVTGQEREIYEGPGGETAAFTACTVEMMDVYRTYDVGVIDEFQLVGDFSRGWAWTRAFMGMQAKQIHLCGSPSMIDIVEKLCRQTGDTLRVVRYERLSPLQVGDDALRNYKNIRPGDCVIGFSRHVLYTIKSQIEQCNHNIRCCVIYGSLPPATRKEQAKLFNSTESKYDVLVASDAVGLGLNLSIRRVILSTLEKYDGRSRRGLYSSEIKQIGGRAGRYNSVFENGEVITLYRKDMNRLTSALHDEDRPVKRAGLSPTIEQLELLGIVEDLDVTEDDLIHFWNDITTEEWGDDITLPESAIKNQLSTEYIIRHFKSTATFARKLSQHIATSRPQSPVHYKYSSYHGPRTSLSSLYTTFRNKASADESFYFICDLEDVAKVASYADHIPLKFKDRITICNAPLSLDDDELMDYFVNYCQAYAKDMPVYLNLPIHGNTPSTLAAVFKLESQHKIVDLYLWLGLHFPHNFIEMEQAVTLALQTSLMIHEGIQLLGVEQYKAAKKKHRSNSKMRR